MEPRPAIIETCMYTALVLKYHLLLLTYLETWQRESLQYITSNHLHCQDFRAGQSYKNEDHYCKSKYT
ncbi:hypothetical protein J437_LFUL016837 [Ladona fulva]|uniref:Uncharacterized protein n=1 Tax=Ladona fulva TaxID=123851 RepID=A0A8K0PCG1_LADFU|nr:hypothetical protein J437_LFUL016837 [Ladona fulva]